MNTLMTECCGAFDTFWGDVHICRQCHAPNPRMVLACDGCGENAEDERGFYHVHEEKFILCDACHETTTNQEGAQ